MIKKIFEFIKKLFKKEKKPVELDALDKFRVRIEARKQFLKEKGYLFCDVCARSNLTLYKRSGKMFCKQHIGK